MIKKIYVARNSNLSQEMVDTISEAKFKELATETYNQTDFIKHVLNNGWDKSNSIAKIIQTKDIKSIDYTNFLSKEMHAIRRLGFRKIQDVVGIISIKTSKALLKIAKFHGGVFCLTYLENDRTFDSILFNEFEELYEELKFFADDSKNLKEDSNEVEEESFNVINKIDEFIKEECNEEI